MLCATHRHGYASWDAIRRDFMSDGRLAFSHPAQHITAPNLQKRVDYRLKGLERDLNLVRQKKARKDYVQAEGTLKVQAEVTRRQALGEGGPAPVDVGNPLGLSNALIAKVEEQVRESERREGV